MTTSAATTTASALQLAAIADASERLRCLQRLTGLGMRLAEEVVERAVNSPYHPEPVHEPARAFATVSRAIRLTLVLQERMEGKLIALRNGAAPAVEDFGAPRVTRKLGADAGGAVLDDVIDDAPDVPGGLRETLRESESERFNELVAGSYDDCVAAIRVDLGLALAGEVPSDDAGVEAALEGVRQRASATLEPSAVGELAGSVRPMEARAPYPADSG